MVDFFNLFRIIFDYIFTFFSLPISIVTALGSINGFLSAVTLAMHPVVASFSLTYTTAIFLISLVLPLLRDFF